MKKLYSILIAAAIVVGCQVDEVEPLTEQERFTAEEGDYAFDSPSRNNSKCNIKNTLVERIFSGNGNQCKSWTTYAYVDSLGNQVAPQSFLDDRIFLRKDGTFIEVDLGIKTPVPGDTVDIGTWTVTNCGRTVSLVSRNFGPSNFKIIQLNQFHAIVKYPYPLPGPYQGRMVSVYLRANREIDSQYCE